MSSAAVVDLCASLDTTCGVQVAQRCIQALGGDAAVPAAVVLHTLLTQLWRKQVGHGCKGRWMLGQLLSRKRRVHSAAIVHTSRHSLQHSSAFLSRPSRDHLAVVLKHLQCRTCLFFFLPLPLTPGILLQLIMNRTASRPC